MKHIVTGSLLLVSSFSALAQPYIPPDYFLEPYKETIGFWEDKGQVIDTQGSPASDVLYYSEGGLPRAYLRDKSKVSFVVAHVDTNLATPDTLWRLDMQPYGDHARNVTPISAEVKDWHQNFYLTHCGDSGVTDVKGYCRVLYQNIFPLIDMHFYSGSAGQKMAFVMKPGCNPADLRLVFTGQDSINVDIWGSLKIYYDGKYLEMPFAQAYQVGTGNTIIPISWMPSYNTANGVVSFNYSTYDATLPLVFQVGPPPAIGGPATTPGVCWAAYLGGDGEDQVFASDVDSQGNYYVAGRTYSPALNFPVQNGTVITDASPKVFLTKFGSNEGLQWSDLYGCEFGDQLANALTAKDNQFGPTLFIGGLVSDVDLIPLLPPGAWIDSIGGGPSGFLAEVRRDNGAFVWSTYFDGYGSAVRNLDIDDLGRLVVTGHTSGNLPMHTVPLPPGAVQWPYSNVAFDAYVAVVNTDHQILWSTYIGWSGFDQGLSVRCGNDRIFVAGYTQSPTMQTLDPGNGAHYVESSSSNDSFIFEFDLNGVQQWGTYTGYAIGMGWQGLAVNRANNDVFLVGSTGSSQLPVTTSAPWYDDTFSGNGDGVIMQFSGLDRSIEYATYVSGSGLDEPRAVVVRSDGQFFVGGLTWDDSF